MTNQYFFSIKKILLFSVIVLVFISSVSLASMTTPSKQILENGLTVLISELPSSPVVTIYCLVKTGSAREGKFLGSGISHFIEHMFFKGTETRKVGEIPEMIQSVGGTINASTGFDHTMYTISVPADQFDVGLDVLSDMLINSTFDSVELEKEREVVVREMQLHNDNPSRQLSKMAFLNSYLVHPYRHPVIGYESIFRKLTRDDILEYYRTRYAPNNMIISIAGNIQKDEVVLKVKKAFEGFLRVRGSVPVVSPEPPQISSRRYEKEYPTDLVRLSMLFSGVRVLDDDMVALDILAKVLGQGKNSRLFLDLYKDKQIVHGIHASNFTPRDRGVFDIQAYFDDSDDGKNIEDVIAGIWGNINQIKKRGILKKELDRIKKKEEADHVFDRQTAAQLSYSHALGEAFLGDPDFDEKYLKAIKELTVERLQDVARKYLLKEKITIVVLRPEKSLSPEVSASSEDAVLENGVQKKVYENGMTVLIKRDSTLPLVSVRLVMKGGLRQETPETNGIFKLMQGVWTKGTDKMTANEIAEFTEERGIRLGSFAGRNSFGLSSSFLSQYVSEGMDLLFDVVSHPTFPEKEIHLVKNNMSVALKSREDSIMQDGDFLLRQRIFREHPYRMDPNGTVESLSVLDRNMIKQMFSKYVVPSNMVLSIVGDVDEDQIFGLINKTFAELSGDDVDWLDVPDVSELSFSEDVVERKKEQALVLVGFRGEDVHSANRYSLEVLLSILGSSFKGRLFEKIREESGLAYSAGGYSIPGLDKGMIKFYALTTMENAEKVKDLIFDQIEDVKMGNIEDSEIKSAKAYLKGTFVAGLETIDSLNFNIALDELYGLGFDYYLKFDELIDSVSKNDLKKTTEKYLDKDKAVVIMVLPKTQSEKP